MLRLNKIFSFIEPCATFADIGCDHGKLSSLVLKNNLAKEVYAADISAPSLKKAQDLLKNYANVSFFVSDGFKSLPSVPDTAVISGMGGREIVNIISGTNVETLILQPQNQIPHLRTYLNESSYEIVKDELVKENNKFYTVLKAVYKSGIKLKILNETEREWGVFYRIKCPLLQEKLIYEKNKLQKFKQTPQNLKKSEMIKEVERWQI